MIFQALSIRQPWAWLIIHGFKDVENRTWQLHRQYCDPKRWTLIHAGKEMLKRDYEECRYFASKVNPNVVLPPYPVMQEFMCGGVVGAVRIVNCVRASSSKWFTGPFGIVMRDPFVFPKMHPCPGKLAIFNVDLPEKLAGCLPP